MLADPNARTRSSSNFAGQWLYLRNLRGFEPDKNEFPDFDDNLRQGLQRETELFFGSIMREDRSVLELMTADYTFVNERLAKHYGIPHVYGSQFRRVPVHDEARKGLLGQGSILHGDVARRSNLAGRARQVDSGQPARHAAAAAAGGRARRSRTTRTTASRSRCASGWRSTARIPRAPSCHKVMDPLGFALENFDAVGAWRTSRRRRRRSTRRVSSRTARRSTASCRCAARCCSGPRSFVVDDDREDADVRAGPGPRRRTTCPRSARSCAARPAQRLSLLVARAGHRQQRAVSDADEGWQLRR